MDTAHQPVVSGGRDQASTSAPEDDRPAEPFRRPRRHFALDAASAPLVTTALAWNAAASR
ncbi:hypothetical protein ACXR2U_10000 [Jatrophihabitans sp. YIM 134969]